MSNAQGDQAWVGCVIGGLRSSPGDFLPDIDQDFAEVFLGTILLLLVLISPLWRKP